MAVEYTQPSKELIDLLYNGVVAFYPDVAKPIFGLGKVSLPYHDHWGGYSRFEFLDLALKATDTNSIEEAGPKIRDWRNGKGLERTVPVRLNELVEEYDEKTKKKNAYEQKVIAKQTLLVAQKEKIEEIEQPAKSYTPPIPEPLKKVEEIKSENAIGIGVEYDKTKADPLEMYRAQLASAPTRLAIGWNQITIKKEYGEEVAVGADLWAHGITSSSLERKLSDLPVEHAKKLAGAIKAIKGLETDPIKTAIIRQAFPIKDINLLLSSETGITQSEFIVFFNPPEEGGTYIYHHQSFVGNLVSSIGKQLFNKAVSKGVSSLIGKAAGSGIGAAAGGATAAGTAAAATSGVMTAAEAAAIGTGTGAAAGAGAGGAAGGPLGAIIGAVVAFILSKLKDIASWFKEHGDALLVGGIGLLAGGAMIGSPALMLGGAGLSGASIAAGGLKPMGSTLSGMGQAVWGGMTGLFIPAVGVPVLIATATVPLLLVFILFIINSGAYMVPPDPASLGVANPYIKVEKIITQTGKNSMAVANSALPITVNYNVTITPLKGSLTNVTIKYGCEALKKGGTAPCPDPTKIIPTGPIEEISPTQPYTFQYAQKFTTPLYMDSLVVDTITVNASVPSDGIDTLAVGSASVIIGNPPVSCPLVGGRISVPSYSTTVGHGSPEYWYSLGKSNTAYPVPTNTGCFSLQDCPYYGYAIDVVSSSWSVLAPTVLGQDVVWEYTGTRITTRGGSAGYGFVYTDKTGKYSLLLLHINNDAVVSGEIKSGQQIGTLFNQGGNTHLHVEIQVDGVYQRPENYFCR